MGASLVRAVIVDDEPDVRDLLKLRLERDGSFEVVAVGGDGPEAIDLCSEHKPDVLILDAMMPSGYGTEVVRDILSVAPSTMVIIYTGDNGTATRDAAERVGAHAVIGKLDPFDLLTGTIFRLLPDKAPVEPPKDDFQERMTSLLEDDKDGGRKGSWFRSGAKSRVLLLLVLLFVVLPLLAGAAWFVAMLAGLTV